MKKEKFDKKSISKIAFERCETTRKGLSWHLCFLMMSIILSLCLGYLIIDSLFITIPFLVIPSFFTFIAKNAYDDKKEIEGLSNFAVFRTYFSRLFFGGFKILVGILKGFLIFIISSFVLMTVAEFTIMPTDSSYVEFANSLGADLSMADSFREITKFAVENELFGKVLTYSQLISLFAAAIGFIHHILKHSIKLYYNFTTRLPMVSPQLNLVYKEMSVKGGRAIFKDYFKATWFLHLLLILSLSGGAAFCIFVFPEASIYEILIISLMFSAVVMLPFMNYLSYVLMAIYLKNSNLFVETFISTSMKLMERYKKTAELNEEEQKQIERILEEAKQEIEKETKKEDK